MNGLKSEPFNREHRNNVSAARKLDFARYTLRKGGIPKPVHAKSGAKGEHIAHPDLHGDSAVADAGRKLLSAWASQQ